MNILCAACLCSLELVGRMKVDAVIAEIKWVRSNSEDDTLRHHYDNDAGRKLILLW